MHQLRALKTQGVALVAQIDAVFALLAGPETAPAQATSGECRHEKRRSVSSMEHPKAWVCDAPGCNGQGEE